MTSMYSDDENQAIRIESKIDTLNKDIVSVANDLENIRNLVKFNDPD